MTLTARDAAGNKTESAKRVFRMPERLFTKPLAKALIEQRRHLILAPDEAGGVAGMLDAILTYPKGPDRAQRHADRHRRRPLAPARGGRPGRRSTR